MTLRKFRLHSPRSWHCHPSWEVCPYGRGIWGAQASRADPQHRLLPWHLCDLSLNRLCSVRPRCYPSQAGQPRLKLHSSGRSEVPHNSPDAPRITDGFVTGQCVRVCHAKSSAEGMRFAWSLTDTAEQGCLRCNTGASFWACKALADTQSEPNCSC